MPDNFGNKRNTNGFDKNPDNINRTGANRKISIKKELEKILSHDGVIKYTGDQVVEFGDENGIKFAKIKMPKQEVLANKMLSIAMGSNNQANTLRALIQILEQFDGKAKQSIDHSSKDGSMSTIKVSKEEIKDISDNLEHDY